MESLGFLVGGFSLIFCMLGTPAAAREPTPAAIREHVSIAAASNLIYALDELNAAFTAIEPAVELTVSSGASGSLVTQISHGASYDVFLSADVEYPQALIAKGFAESRSLVIFAAGELVLWTTHPAVALDSMAAAISNPSVRKIAVANMDSAPYGRAAREALKQLGLFSQAEPKLVIGENITQAAQFVETGNAELGLVALSLVLSPRLKNRGHWIAVPPDTYPRLDHAAVLTSRAKNNPAASRYLAFLSSDRAREILRRFGYQVPERR